MVSSQSAGRPALGERGGVVPGRHGHRGGRVRPPARTGRGGVLDPPRSERERRELADARAEEIRWRLVRMNVDNGVRMMDQGDTTGASPGSPRRSASTATTRTPPPTHRLRLGTLLNQCPALDGLFAHTGRSSGRRSTRRAGGSPPPRPTTRRGVWDLDGGRGDHAAPGPRRPGQLGRISRRRGRLVTASADGTVRIWDARRQPGGRRPLADAWVARADRPVQPRRQPGRLGRRSMGRSGSGTPRTVLRRHATPARLAPFVPGLQPRRYADRHCGLEDGTRSGGSKAAASIDWRGCPIAVRSATSRSAPTAIVCSPPARMGPRVSGMSRPGSAHGPSSSTPAGSRMRNSAPMAIGWSPPVMTGRHASGMPRPAPHRVQGGRDAATRSPWAMPGSAPTAVGSPRPVSTARPGSGMPPAANRSRRRSITAERLERGSPRTATRC